MTDFYREQVGVKTDPGLTVSRRTPMEGALQNVGSTLSGISTSYMRQMGREEAEASIAAEDVRSKRSWLEAEVQMSEMTEPKEISSFYEDWESSEREAIGDIETNRLGKRAIGFRSDRNLSDRRIKALGMGGFADQAQISKNAQSWFSLSKHADMGIVADGFDSPEHQNKFAADKLLKSKIINPRQHVEMVEGFESRKNEAMITGELAGMQESYVRGETGRKEYISTLEAIRDEGKDLKLTTGQRRNIDVTISSRLSHLIGQEVNNQQSALSNMKEKITKRDFDIVDQMQTSEAFGEPFADGIITAQDQMLRGMAGTDAGVQDVVDILDLAIIKDAAGKTKDGKPPISWAEGLHKIEKSDADPSIKYVATMLLADNYMEMTERHGFVTPYESWFKNVKMPSDGTAEKVVRGVAYYTEKNGIGSAFVMESFREYSKWKESGKYKGEDATEAELLEGLFQKQAMEFIMSGSAPQIRNATAPDFEKMSDEELKAYIDG